MKTIIRLISAFCLTTSVMADPSAGEPLEDYHRTQSKFETHLASIQNKIEEHRTKLDEDYLQTLDRLKMFYRSRANLDGALDARTEADRFKQSRSLTKQDIHPSDRNLIKVQTDYLKNREKLMTEAVGDNVHACYPGSLK
ncbi:MAG: hypothetical protein AAF492_12710 [Verrucomicrobiota bacterium]